MPVNADGLKRESESVMKKALVLLILTLALLMCFVSCDQGGTQDPTPEHTHNFGEWSTTKNATCTEDGVKTRYCNCGEKQSDTIPATGHEGQILPAKESTCTENGLTEGKKCSVCEEILVAQQETPLKAHAEVIDLAVEATCTKSGLSEGKHCSVCNKVLMAQQETPVVAHTYDDKYDETCSKCGYVRDAECAHKETEVITGYDATCTSAGLTDGSKCKKCGEILTSQTVIDVKAHTEVIDSAVSATCISTGLTEGKHCFSCGIVIIAQEVIPATGHSFGEWVTVKEATTNEEGLQERSCVCGEKETRSLDKISIGLEYTLNSDGKSYSVTGIGNYTDGDIVIPTKYNGLPVTSIEDYAFSDCMIGIRSVTIPDSVTSIEDYAFQLCSTLASVSIPNSVTNIGERAFQLCPSLTSIVIPDSVTSMGVAAFGSCTSLKNITIPSSLTYVVDEAFANCTSLETVIIDGKVTSIGHYAFYGCTNLTSINFGGTIEQWNAVNKLSAWDGNTGSYIIYCTDGEIAKDGTITYYPTYSEGLEFTHHYSGYYSVTGIGTCTDTIIVIPDTYNGIPVKRIEDRAFQNCTAIESVIIPDTVTAIGSSVFYKCTSLSNVVIPDSVTTIGEWTFAYCSSIGTIDLPENLTTISSYLFEKCTSLKNIIIPDNVTYVGYSFYGCTSLETVTLGKNITDIYSLAFSNTSVSTLIFKGDVIPHNEFLGGSYVNYYAGLKSLKTIIIEGNVTALPEQVFKACDSLETIFLPKSIISIGPEAFYDCSSLITIYYDGTVANWNAISKTRSFNNYDYPDEFTIKCSDGEIAKDGTVTYY